ncbi:MAG: putative glutamine-dependent NAD(+) synthetase [Dehalococcoidia bacterium]|nr:MAG: putative glutamine-dependent NAD(+) synthetase [Dehalococcoidia bacterium]
MRIFRLALAQLNLTVGDLDGNAAKIRRSIAEARAAGAHLVAFPELALTGYPPEDLLLKPAFLEATRAELEKIARGTVGIVAVVGFVEAAGDSYNAAAIIHDGRIVDIYRKHYLPNYGVFDEYRYFRAGDRYPVYDMFGVKVGVNICEDIWYPVGPTTVQAFGGAEVIVNINASPYHIGKWRFREKMLATRAWDCGVAVAYCNVVGGQDELVFDGGSMVFDQSATLIARSPAFEEDLLLVDLDVDAVFLARLHDPRARQSVDLFGDVAGKIDHVPVASEPLTPPAGMLTPRIVPRGDDVDEVYAALVLATRDYVRKNGFSAVHIGLSGGIDSSLVAAIAVDALGPENVTGVSMPSRFSSPGSKEDARALADALGIRFVTLPIEEPFQAMLDVLEPCFRGTPFGTAEENLQARIRGNLLMALSNKFNTLVLTTGNKSEMATGYSTLYGDMAGGFAVIKDVPKTLVYQLARRRNERGPVIPETVLTKAPSAELRPNQKDEDSLPPYHLLDPILELYVEQDRSPQEIVALGHDPAIVNHVVRLVDRSEYKRRQAPPGVKITQRAFGRDRRLPIVNGFQGA